MEAPYSYDIAFLGLKDPSSGGRARMINAMERLTRKSTAECQGYLSRIGLTLFGSLPPDQAELILKALDDAGVICEVRPKDAAAQSMDDVGGGSMIKCPSCGFVQPAGGEECQRCGVIYSKMEKDEIRQMQKDTALEEAQQRAEQIRQEWDDRARQLVSSRPLPAGALVPFEAVLSQQEIPFLALESIEGPLLMTSRQIIGSLEGGEIVCLPYEIIKDVDFGGGLVVKKGHTRFLLHFHLPVPCRGKTAGSLNWQLTSHSATNKETIMDWAFARSYICGSCGARDLDYRSDKGGMHARCMHCATDHDIDLMTNTISPRISS